MRAYKNYEHHGDRRTKEGGYPSRQNIGFGEQICTSNLCICYETYVGGDT
jgi:hypothetical protein